MKCNLSKDISSILDRYVTIDTEQTITARKVFVGSINLKQKSPNADFVSGITWYNYNGIKQAALYANVADNKIYINPTGADAIWDDVLGKYNLVIGKNEFKYNTSIVQVK